MDRDAVRAIVRAVVVPVLRAADLVDVAVVAVEFDVKDVAGQFVVLVKTRKFHCIPLDAPALIGRMIHHRTVDLRDLQGFDDGVDRHFHQSRDQLRSRKIHRNTEGTVFFDAHADAPLDQRIVAFRACFGNGDACIGNFFNDSADHAACGRARETGAQQRLEPRFDVVAHNVCGHQRDLVSVNDRPYRRIDIEFLRANRFGIIVLDLADQHQPYGFRHLIFFEIEPALIDTDLKHRGARDSHLVCFAVVFVFQVIQRVVLRYFLADEIRIGVDLRGELRTRDEHFLGLRLDPIRGIVDRPQIVRVRRFDQILEKRLVKIEHRVDDAAVRLFQPFRFIIRFLFAFRKRFQQTDAVAVSHIGLRIVDVTDRYGFKLPAPSVRGIQRDDLQTRPRELAFLPLQHSLDLVRTVLIASVDVPSEFHGIGFDAAVGDGGQLSFLAVSRFITNQIPVDFENGGGNVARIFTCGIEHQVSVPIQLADTIVFFVRVVHCGKTRLPVVVLVELYGLHRRPCAVRVVLQNSGNGIRQICALLRFPFFFHGEAGPPLGIDPGIPEPREGEIGFISRRQFRVVVPSDKRHPFQDGIRIGSFYGAAVGDHLFDLTVLSFHDPAVEHEGDLNAVLEQEAADVQQIAAVRIALFRGIVDDHNVTAQADVLRVGERGDPAGGFHPRDAVGNDEIAFGLKAGPMAADRDRTARDDDAAIRAHRGIHEILRGRDVAVKGQRAILYPDGGAAELIPGVIEICRTGDDQVDAVGIYERIVMKPLHRCGRGEGQRAGIGIVPCGPVAQDIVLVACAHPDPAYPDRIGVDPYGGQRRVLRYRQQGSRGINRFFAAALRPAEEGISRRSGKARLFGRQGIFAVLVSPYGCFRAAARAGIKADAHAFVAAV